MTEYRQQVAVHTNSLLQRGCSHFGAIMPAVAISFNLTGRTAGMVRYTRNRTIEIRYNGQLLRENREDFILRTVPHEVAHVVTKVAFGAGCRPHGDEWRQVMAFFGADSSRCHSYDTSRASTRQLQRHSYMCGCRQHQLTSIRHNRIGRGQGYNCRQCGD